MRMKTGWLRYLMGRRGTRTLHQFIHMARLHRTPFETLLKNIFEVTDQYKACFTFPVVASAATKSPELIRMIVKSPHEIAAHGFKHVSYRYLSKEEQEIDIKRCTSAFAQMRITIHGFRAPYNNYTDYTPGLLERRHFLWDGGIGYHPKYWHRTRPFRIQVDDHQSAFVCIPLSEWSDDRMIDQHHMSNQQMVKTLCSTMKRAAQENGIVMFDLHPIRIGQYRYLDVLRQMLVLGSELGGWFPTVTEAVNYWHMHQQWKNGASFCCLLTGDVDNFTFADYLLRLT
jgi:peptidoglycan/xylan/chitin deacetylase (PgdA/CDA1 family)